MPHLPRPSSGRAYRCEEVDQAAVTQPVNGFVAWDKDREGPRPIQDGRQPAVLWQWEGCSGRLCGQPLPLSPAKALLPSACREYP